MPYAGMCGPSFRGTRGSCREYHKRSVRNNFCCGALRHKNVGVIGPSCPVQYFDLPWHVVVSVEVALPATTAKRAVMSLGLLRRSFNVAAPWW